MTSNMGNVMIVIDEIFSTYQGVDPQVNCLYSYLVFIHCLALSLPLVFVNYALNYYYHEQCNFIFLHYSSIIFSFRNHAKDNATFMVQGWYILSSPFGCQDEILRQKYSTILALTSHELGKSLKIMTMVLYQYHEVLDHMTQLNKDKCTSFSCFQFCSCLPTIKLVCNGKHKL